MTEARDITATVFKNGSCILLARVLGNAAAVITKASLSSAAYTIYLLDESNPDTATAVTGHTAVALTVADCVFDALQKDDLWKDDAGDYLDASGYNFRYQLNVATTQAFSSAGRSYRIVVTLTPVTGQPILVRFRVAAI